MYGKALAQYLQLKLGERGYDAPFICCEDWGWWVELKAPFTFGVCIYCGPEREGEGRYHVVDRWSPRGTPYAKLVEFLLKLCPSQAERAEP
jgi:hypothetical protein